MSSKKNLKVIFLVLSAFFLFPGRDIYSGPASMTVAILDFKITGVSADEVSLLKDFLGNALFQTGMFNIVQKERLTAVLKEIEFSYSDIADPDKTKKIGTLLSANLLLFGSIGKIGKYVIFNLTLVEVETGKTAGTFSNNYLSMEEIVADMNQIASYLAGTANPDYVAVEKTNPYEESDMTKTETSSFYNNPQLLWTDDFEEKIWLENEYLSYSNGRYLINSFDQDYYTWFTGEYDDYIFEVEVEWISGREDTGMGVLFRIQDESNFYIFDITRSGYYIIDKVIGGNYQYIMDWKTNSIIKSKGTNKLKVHAVGNNFKLYINNTLVEEITDDTYRKGMFGIFGGNGVKAAFDNMWVYRGDLIIYDTFTKDTGNWYISKWSKIFNNQYQLLPNDDGYMTWRGDILKNFSIQADTIYLFGNDSGYGLLFNMQDTNNFIQFLISSSGSYYLGILNKGQLSVLIDWTESKFIEPNGKNSLKIEYRNGNIQFYINNNFIAEVFNNTFKGGKAGVITYGNDHVAYDNIAIFSIQ